MNNLRAMNALLTAETSLSSFDDQRTKMAKAAPRVADETMSAEASSP